MDDKTSTTPEPTAPLPDKERLESVEMTPPTSPSRINEKNVLADSTNPIISPPTPLRVSPPPSYTSNNYKKCDNKKSGNCIYCGYGNTSPYYDSRRKNHIDNESKSIKLLTFFGFILLFILMFLLLIYGNQHLFKSKTFNGWCGTSYVDEGRPKQFAQEMEINSDDLYEKIQVPKFGMNRPAIFVHDFRKNITAIVDVLGDRCFLKPLDRSIVVPPKNFIDLLQKMENGYYAQNPRVIHETFRVGNRLDSDDLLNLGSAMVSRHCNNKDVYQLVKTIRTMDSPYFVRDKRAIRSKLSRKIRSKQQPMIEPPLQFSVLNGDNVGIERIIF